MSKLDDIEVNRKKTLATTIRCDIRTVASLALFWKSKGENLQSLNSIFRLSLEGMKEMIIDSYPENEITTTTMATELLESLGLLDIAKDFPNKHSLLKELSLESLLLEGIDPTITTKEKIKKKQLDLGMYSSEQEKEHLHKSLEKRIGPTIVIKDQEEMDEAEEHKRIVESMKLEKGGDDAEV